MKLRFTVETWYEMDVPDEGYDFDRVCKVLNADVEAAVHGAQKSKAQIDYIEEVKFAEKVRV